VSTWYSRHGNISNVRAISASQILSGADVGLRDILYSVLRTSMVHAKMHDLQVQPLSSPKPKHGNHTIGRLGLHDPLQTAWQQRWQSLKKTKTT
jgi:hypothetical protein